MKCSDEYIYSSLKSLKDKEGSPLSEKNIIAYEVVLKRIGKYLNTKSIYTIWTSPDESFKKLKHSMLVTDKLCKSTFNNTISVFIAVMKRVDCADTKFVALWHDLIKEISDEIKSDRKSNIPKGKQLEGMVTWSSVLKKNDELYKTSFGSIDNIIISIYCDIYPRREEDYFRLRIIGVPVMGIDGKPIVNENDPDKDSGTLDMSVSPPKLTIVKFKTSKYYGPWTRDVPPRLAKAIKLSLKNKPRHYLFCKGDDTPFTEKAYTNFHLSIIKHFFGPAVTNNSLRHALATYIHQTSANKLSLGDKEKIARDMSHSFVTSVAYSHIV
jgi:hypothetical protein